MTIALCLFCGEQKVGAITPCRNCGRESTGDFELDITFSDHRISHSNISEFGAIIRTIGQDAGKDELTFWAFLAHVGQTYPELLTAEPPSELAGEVSQVLATVDLPRVQLELREPTESRRPSGNGFGCIAVALIVAIALFAAAYLVSGRLTNLLDVRAMILAALGLVFLYAGVSEIWRSVRERGSEGDDD